MNVEDGSNIITNVGKPLLFYYLPFTEARTKVPKFRRLALSFALMEPYWPEENHPVQEVREIHILQADKAREAGLTKTEDTLVRMARLVLTYSTGAKEVVEVPVECEPDSDEHPPNCICVLAGKYASSLCVRPDNLSN